MTHSRRGSLSDSRKTISSSKRIPIPGSDAETDTDLKKPLQEQRPHASVSYPGNWRRNPRTKLAEWRCPRDGTLLTDISFHWLGFQVKNHLIEDYSGRSARKKDDGRQRDMKGDIAYLPIKKGTRETPINSTVEFVQYSIVGGETVKMPGKWKKRESGGTWGGKDTKEGDVITGKLIRTEANANADEKNPLIDFILDTGKEGEVRVWGSAVLMRRLSAKDVGQQVRITFKGMKKAAKGKMKDYEVEVQE